MTHRMITPGGPRRAHAATRRPAQLPVGHARTGGPVARARWLGGVASPGTSWLGGGSQPGLSGARPGTDPRATAAATATPAPERDAPESDAPERNARSGCQQLPYSRLARLQSRPRARGTGRGQSQGTGAGTLALGFSQACAARTLTEQQGSLSLLVPGPLCGASYSLSGTCLVALMVLDFGRVINLT
jgi:hypothetical protein